MKVKISSSPIQNELEEIDLSSTTRRGHECIVGRSPDSDVVLDSDDVSRMHGKFFYQSGNYYFCDLGSRNGTIINGKILQKNHSCILNDGDIIRIGDFALMLEEDISFSEQSETVVRIINPSMFSSLQRNQSNKVEKAEEINQISEEPTFVQPDEEISQNSVEFRQDNQINQISDTPVEAIENISSAQPEYTIVQPRDIFPENSDENDNDSIQVETQEDNSDLNLEENTEAQAGKQEDFDDLYEQEIASIDDESTEAQAGKQEDFDDLSEQEIASIDQENTEAEAEGEQEIASIDDENTEAEAEGEQEDFDDLNQQEIASIDQESTEAEAQSEQEDFDDLNQQEIAEAESGMIEVTNNEYVDSDMANTEEVGEASMSVTADSDEVAQETSQEIEESDEEESTLKIASILQEKRIVLVSHETKKSELKELISEHEEFLSYCQTLTWQTYNDYLYRQTGLSVTEDIPPATSGGYQAINSLINSEKIIAVIFLRDLTVPQQGTSF